jgi:hypothetical protein
MIQMLFALAMIGVAVVFAAEASTYRWTAARSPTILAAVVGLLALGMFIEAALKLWRDRRGGAAAADPGDLGTVSHVAARTGAESLPRALAFLAVVVLYTFTFRTVGFLLGSGAFLAGTMLLFRSTRPLYVLLATSTALAVIYVVFVAFLRLPVPLWPRF